MLTTRLWMGAILVALTACMLAIDQYLAPWYPFLFLFVIILGAAACHELIQLLGPNREPQPAVCITGVVLLGAGNWLAQMRGADGELLFDPAAVLGAIFAGVVLVSFAFEMASFSKPGRSLECIALTIFVVAYLGVFPCFLAQTRWVFLPERLINEDLGDFIQRLHRQSVLGPVPAQQQLRTACSVALALAIFVPKCCDIGAYCTGRLIGRHKMTPVLSPKKTWEGAVGGLVLASVVTVGINRLSLGAVLPETLGIEIAFGVVVGIAGMLGDLAESLIKRDCQHKDASQAVPGFGGVLDVVDSVIFSAPVSYGFFSLVSAPLRY